MNKVLIFICGAVLFCGFGCGDNPNEHSHPLVVKYKRVRNDHNYREAAEFLNRYLKIRPNSRIAHLELASLYDENLNDPLAAIYHYRCQLEIDSHSQKEEIEKWRAAAERKYYNQAKLKLNDPEDVVTLQDSLHETEQALKLAQAENRRLLGVVNSGREQLAKVEHDLKLKTIEATDVSILKEQLRQSNSAVRKLEIYRDSMTQEDKNKDLRLAELRNAIALQNTMINDLTNKLAGAEKENAKLPELLKQYQELQNSARNMEQEIKTLKEQLKTKTLEEGE